jgi:hypothetical protein
MASTATTVLRLEKIGSGEQAGTWDDSIATLFDMIDRAHSGIGISTTGGDTTLSNVDFTLDQAKAETLEVSGTLSSNATIIIPNAKKKYIVKNGTSGAFTLSIKTSSGSAITITQSSAATVYCDGSNGMSYVTPQVVMSTGAPTDASGAAASAVAVTPTGNLAATTVQAGLAELQGDIDAINTALGTKQGLNATLTALSALAVTKGNMIAANGTAYTALAVGTNGLVQRANSGAATGIEWAAGAPATTKALFQQTAAPTGWTKDTTHNNKAIRIVSGTASSGGSTAFTSVFTTRTIAANQLPNITMTVTDSGHRHFGFVDNSEVGGDTLNNDSQVNKTTTGAGDNGYLLTRNSSDATVGRTSVTTTGISAAIDNTARGAVAQQTIDFAVQYVDVVAATAD